MSAPQSERGVFVLSIDLPPIRSIGPTNGLVDLLKVVSGFGVAATWYSPDPASSADVERILAVMPAQEIGISGDSTWATTGVGRTLFLRELSRRVARCESSGYSITSLAVPQRVAAEHLDLAVKHGIQCVRISPNLAPTSLLTRSLALLRSSAAVGDVPRIGRFGLWQAPVSLRFPERERYSSPAVVRQAQRGLQQAMDHGYFHLVIDLALGSDVRGSLAKTVEKILAAARTRATSEVAVLSVRQLVHRLTSQRRAVPAQSFLRRRAA
jgi:hypothetical protein